MTLWHFIEMKNKKWTSIVVHIVIAVKMWYFQTETSPCQLTSYENWSQSLTCNWIVRSVENFYWKLGIEFVRYMWFECHIVQKLSSSPIFLWKMRTNVFTFDELHHVLHLGLLAQFLLLGGRNVSHCIVSAWQRKCFKRFTVSSVI